MQKIVSWLYTNICIERTECLQRIGHRANTSYTHELLEETWTIWNKACRIHSNSVWYSYVSNWNLLCQLMKGGSGVNGGSTFIAVSSSPSSSICCCCCCCSCCCCCCWCWCWCCWWSWTSYPMVPTMSHSASGCRSPAMSWLITYESTTCLLSWCPW